MASAFAQDMRRQRAERILEAATRVASRRGWTAFTIDEVAAAAGVAKGTVYLHFPGKEALIAAIAESAARQLTGIVHAEAAGDADPGEQLRQIFRRWRTVSSRNCAIPALVLCGTTSAMPRDEHRASPLWNTVDELVPLIIHAQNSGAIHARLNARAVAAVLLGLHLCIASVAEHPQSEELARDAWGLLEQLLSASTGEIRATHEASS
ncbi:MAG: TetR/AcrR family transcriptional regulator, fatty acid metabolism regulator protein [Chloroflexota bacterium]|nr:TetR/AcrR family transcriptional regulator, fatty acid metabolism regulator protein [Chloroflexota bacterium]